MIFVCAGIVILSGLCGYFYSNRYVSKVKFCNDLIDFCHFLEVNINFSQDKLPQLFNFEIHCSQGSTFASSPICQKVCRDKCRCPTRQATAFAPPKRAWRKPKLRDRES